MQAPPPSAGAETIVLVAPAIFDLDSACEVIEELDVVMTRADHVVVDLSEVEYMNHAGATVLLWAHRHLKARDGSLTLRRLPPHVRSVLSVSGVLEELCPPQP